MEETEINYEMRMKFVTQYNGDFYVNDSIFAKMDNIFAQLLNKINVEKHKKFDDDHLAKFLHEGKAISGAELIGNLGNGNEATIYVIEKTSPAYKRFRNIEVLARNVAECNKTAAGKINPR